MAEKPEEVETEEPKIIEGEASRVEDEVSKTSEANEKPAESPTKSGGGKKILVLLIVLILGGGGAYGSYPMWRGEVQPYAEMVGLDLPVIDPLEQVLELVFGAPPESESETPVADATPATTAEAETEPKPAEAPSAPTDEAATAPMPPVTAPDPAMSQSVSMLEDRLAGLERKLSEALAAQVSGDQLGELATSVSTIERKLQATSDEMAIIREGLAGGDGGNSAFAEDLSARLQLMQEQIGVLEQGAATPLDDGRLKALESALTEVNDRITGEIDRSAEDVLRLEGRFATIEARLEELSEQIALTLSARERGAILLILTANLADAAGGSGDFSAELQAVKAMAGEEGPLLTAIQELEPLSTGVASSASLALSLGAVVSKVTDQANLATGEGDTVDQVLSKMSALISIRRIDGGDTAGAPLLGAETMMASGDVAGAIAALKGSEMGGNPDVKDWLAKAEQRQKVDAAVRVLRGAAAALAGEV